MKLSSTGMFIPKNTLCFSLLILLIPSVITCNAGEYDNELLQFDFEIEIASITEVEPAIDTRILVDKLRLSLPVYPPTLTPEQVEIKIEHDLNEIVETHFPNKKYREIKKVASEKFKMFKIFKPNDANNEVISIVRQYNGQPKREKGFLMRVTPKKVLIGSLAISRVDISKNDLARLYLDEHEIAAKKYIKIETRKFDDQKEIFSTEQRRQLVRKIWLESGYKKLKRSGKWVPSIDLYYKHLDRIESKLLLAKREEVRERVYQANGYTFIEETGEWIPQNVIDQAAKAAAEKAIQKEQSSLLGKVKGFFKTKVDVQSTEKTDTDEGGADAAENLETDAADESENAASGAAESESDSDSSDEEQPASDNLSDSDSANEDVSDLYDE